MRPAHASCPRTCSLPCWHCCSGEPQRTPPSHQPLTGLRTLPLLIGRQRVGAVSQRHRQLARPQTPHSLRLLLCWLGFQQGQLEAAVNGPQLAAFCGWERGRARGRVARGQLLGCGTWAGPMHACCCTAVSAMLPAAPSSSVQAVQAWLNHPAAGAPMTCRPPAVRARSQASRMRVAPSLPPACTSGSKSRVNLRGGCAVKGRLESSQQLSSRSSRRV